MLVQHVDHCPGTARRAIRKLADGDTLNSLEMATLSEHRQLPVNLAEIHVCSLQQKDAAFEIRKYPSSGCSQHFQIAAHQETLGTTAACQSGRFLFMPGLQDEIFVALQHPTYRRGTFRTDEAEFIVEERAVNSWQLTVFPKTQMQNRDVAEPDNKLRVAFEGFKVEPVGNARR